MDTADLCSLFFFFLWSFDEMSFLRENKMLQKIWKFFWERLSNIKLSWYNNRFYGTYKTKPKWFQEYFSSSLCLHRQKLLKILGSCQSASTTVKSFCYFFLTVWTSSEIFQNQMLPRAVHRAEWFRAKQGGGQGKTALTQHAKSAKLLWVYWTISTQFILPLGFAWESFWFIHYIVYKYCEF